MSGDTSFAVALEKPGNDIDSGQFRQVDPDLANFQADEEIPDITAQFHSNRDWGYFQIAGILRRVGVENIANPANIIEHDVQIKRNCIILKGVRIGARAVVGAGSVVRSDVPADAIVAGNPARVVKKITESERAA